MRSLFLFWMRQAYYNERTLFIFHIRINITRTVIYSLKITIVRLPGTIVRLSRTQYKPFQFNSHPACLTNHTNPGSDYTLPTAGTSSFPSINPIWYECLIASLLCSKWQTGTPAASIFFISSRTSLIFFS